MFAADRLSLPIMKKFHVLVSLRMETTATRGKMAGVIAFASNASDWELHFIPYELKGAALRKAVEAIRPDGAINPPPGAEEILCCPTVVMDILDGYANHDAVFTCDDRRVGKVAAEHLWQRSFRQFAYVGCDYPLDVAHSEERHEAFSHELRRLGHVGEVPCIDLGRFALMHTRAPGHIVEWLKALPKPCGLFAYNDFTCLYVMSACRDAHIKIPEQIGLLGADDETAICESTRPTLSSIEPDFVGAGFQAAKQLDRFMRTGAPKKPLVRQYGVKKLHSRLSTLSVIVPMKLVGAIMERIRVSEGKGISIQQLAKEFGVSKRMLEYRFKSGQGDSIRSEILKAKLAAVERLLTTTTMPIKDISYMTDFGSGANLRYVFRKHRGVSLAQYRQDHSLK